MHLRLFYAIKLTYLLTFFGPRLGYFGHYWVNWKWNHQIGLDDFRTEVTEDRND